MRPTWVPAWAEMRDRAQMHPDRDELHPDRDGLQVSTSVSSKAETERHCFSFCTLSLASVKALLLSMGQ